MLTNNVMVCLGLSVSFEITVTVRDTFPILSLLSNLIFNVPYLPGKIVLLLNSVTVQLHDS